MYGEGISKVGEILIWVLGLILLKMVRRFQLGDTKLGQGRDAVKELLKTILNFRKLAEKIKVAIKEKK